MAAALPASAGPDACRPCAASMPPRRWRRFAERVGLPGTAREVRWGRLQFDGVPLASQSVPVIVATRPDAAPPGTWTIACWRRLLPRVVRRAERVAARLASWRTAADAAVAAGIAEDGSSPHLFDDARESPARLRHRDSSRPTVTFMVDGRLGARR
jgi:hypothetical protein